MKKNLRRLLSISLLAASLLSLPAIANWKVQNDDSSVHFISTKNQHFSEVHHFNKIQGYLKRNGLFELEIDLASIDSAIEIRNSRMREHLFKVDIFPSAKVTATLPQNIMQLKLGQSRLITVDSKLLIMQTQLPLSISLQVTKTENGYLATSVQPILLSAATVGYQSGLAILQKLAGLSSIGLMVPVNFNLRLSKAD
jgi:uncharacterized protein YpmS